MSIDLDIAPRQGNAITWAHLRHQWQQRLGEAGANMLGSKPQLCHIGSAVPVAEDEPIALSSPYFFNLTDPCTLSLSAMPNEGNLDEFCYLEDYGRNLDPSMTTEFAEQWRRVGYWYGISSSGGRSGAEPALLITLVCALADLCEGLIIVTNDGIFDLGVGVYTPAQFSTARWLRTS